MKVKEENKLLMKAKADLQQQLQEAVQASAKKALQQLPDFTQYSPTRTEAVPPGDVIFTYLEDNFLRTATWHRGPRQGDPHRSAPEFQVRTFRVRVTMRLEISAPFFGSLHQSSIFQGGWCQKLQIGRRRSHPKSLFSDNNLR